MYRVGRDIVGIDPACGACSCIEPWLETHVRELGPDLDLLHDMGTAAVIVQAKEQLAEVKATLSTVVGCQAKVFEKARLDNLNAVEAFCKLLIFPGRVGISPITSLCRHMYGCDGVG